MMKRILVCRPIDEEGDEYETVGTKREMLIFCNSDAEAIQAGEEFVKRLNKEYATPKYRFTGIRSKTFLD